jgi:hypothetical protein
MVTLIMSIAVVTKGPDAMAGSTFILARVIGTRDPARAAMVMEENTPIATDKVNSV